MAIVSGRISKEMGYTVEEFSNVLPRAMRDWSIVEAQPLVWSVITRDGEALAQITVMPRPDRRIASLTLPTLSVDIEFDTHDNERRIEFVRRFDRGFQKGGG